MASTYSTNLKIELQATGENSGTWGTITNTNLGTALEQAIVGYGNPNYASDANLTLTYTDTNAAQAARALVLNVTSGVSLTGTRELVVPTIQKQYIVQNNTTGSQSITVKTSAGTGITVPNGRKAHLYVNGTDVIYMDDYVDINGGAIDGTPIGANSASTGAFSTLSASGNVTLSGGTANGVLYLDASKVATSGSAVTYNGTTFTTTGAANFATSSGNVVVGATSISGWPNGKLLVKQSNAGVDGGFSVTSSSNANTTYFSHTGTLAAIGADYGSGGSYTPLTFLTGGSERMRLDTTGNLGLGVTPGAWAGKAIQIGTYSGYGIDGNGNAFMANNAINTSSSSYVYAASSLGATQYRQAFGVHSWYTAPSGTAGNTITFTQAMTLDSSGNVGIGTASPQKALNVVVSSSSTTIGGSDAVIQVGNSNGAALNLTAGIELFGSGAPSSGLGNRSGGIYGIYEAFNAGGNAGALAFATNPAGTTSVVERMRIDSSGNVGIGGTAAANAKVHVLGTLPTSSNNSQAFRMTGEIPSGSTTLARSFFSFPSTQAASFTLTDLYHFDSFQGSFGAGSAVTNQYGFHAGSSLTGATNNYGFYGNIAAGSNRWNFYAAGTARNYFAGGVEDANGNLRKIPQSGSAKTTSYSLATTDVGLFIEVGSGGSITVPNSTFSAGDVVSIFNNTSGNVTLTMSITTAYIGGTDADKATITLATRGVATILFISGTVCVVNGNVS